MPRSTRFSRDTSTAGNPIVADHLAGLEWQGCMYGQTGDSCGSGSATMMLWQDALASCEGLSWAGHTDWRLPNANELTSLVDDHTSSPASDTTAFPGLIAAETLTSTSESAPGYSSQAFDLNFVAGSLLSRAKTDNTFFRCVRDEP